MNLFDTDIIIESLRKGKYEDGAISIITIIEILRGIDAKKRSRVKELLEESFNVENLDNKTVEAYCNLHQNLKKQGESLPDADMLIAATAISRNMNPRTKDQHFQRLRKLGLKLTPPEK